MTTFVMGCAFGILQSQALSGFYDEVAWAAVGVPSFFMAAFLLFASALWFRLDFNRMIYKIGFFTMAMGFLLVFLGGTAGVVGYAVLCTGYRYSDLLLWGLCAYLIYRRGYDAPWVIGLSMGPLLLGRCAGFLTVTVLSWGDNALAGLQNVAVVMGFVLLTSALFIENRNNLVEAWGSERLGDTAEDERVRELCCSMLAETHALSPRETEILGYLAQGMTRKDIGEKLVLSGETVKTHIQHIYEKCGVHSKQELLDLVEFVSRDLGMRDER